MTFINQLLDVIKPNDLVIFSGSLPKGIEHNFYYQLIHMVQEKGAKSILDTSGVFLEEGVKAKPWLTKVNESEFYELVGQSHYQSIERPIEDILQELPEEENFIVTRGGKGSIAKFGKDIFHLKLPVVNAKNATASGDIFLGALSIGLSSNLSHEDALIKASTYSLSNCLYWYPHIELSDVEHYKSQILVEKIGGEYL